MELQPLRARRFLQVSNAPLCIRIVRVHQQGFMAEILPLSMSLEMVDFDLPVALAAVPMVYMRGC